MTTTTNSSAKTTSLSGVAGPANNPMAGLESMTEAQKHVHEILSDLRTVMLVTFDDPEGAVRGARAGSAGPLSGLNARPMRIARLDPDGTLWFVTAIDSPKVGEATSPPIGHVIAQTSMRYVSLAGTFTVTRDREALERVWSKSNDAWFPEGTKDPRACLLGFHPTEAEFWDMSGAKGLSYVFEAAKALLTGKAIEPKNDGEQHGKISMM